jgi:Cu(I)/Ag(I) efflux system membrane fusion protein
LQAVAETENSLQESYTGYYQSRENKKYFGASDGPEWKIYFKTEGDYIQKNQAVYQLYSEDLAIAKHDYFTAFKQLSMPGDFGKKC